MKFKISQGCDLFDAFCKKLALGNHYQEIAKEWASKNGATEWAEPYSSFKGGVAGLVFKEKPSGWASLEDGIYRPRLNSALFKEMKALPFLGYVEINELLCYKPKSVAVGGGKMRIMHYPGVYVLDDCILLNFSDYITYYKPIDGMIEILESEYRAMIEADKKISENG